MNTTTTKRRAPLLDHLDQIEAHGAKGDIELQLIFKIFGNDGHYLLIFFLILPFLQPVPLMGLSTPFGLLIAVVAYFAFLKKPPIIPKRWSHTKLPGGLIKKIAEAAEVVFDKLAFFIHPRWKTFFRAPFRTVNSVLIIGNALLLALPLPIPFSNAVPGWGILLQALAHLEDDGFLIVLSYLQGLLCLVYFGLLLSGLTAGLDYLHSP